MKCDAATNLDAVTIANGACGYADGSRLGAGGVKFINPALHIMKLRQQLGKDRPVPLGHFVAQQLRLSDAWSNAVRAVELIRFGHGLAALSQDAIEPRQLLLSLLDR